MSAELRAARRDDTLVLTILNSGMRNALHPDMYAPAIEALSTAERDDSIRAVILTGANGIFSDCALDNPWSQMMRRSQADSEAIAQLQGWIEAIRDCPKPVIAAVEGVAAGSGFALALACDLIIAGSSSRFSMPWIKKGLTPEAGSWFLMQALPRQLVSELLMTGNAVSAERLFHVGLLNKLVPDGSALDEALSWTEGFAASSASAVEQIKALLRGESEDYLNRHLETERQCFIENLQQKGSRT